MELQLPVSELKAALSTLGKVMPRNPSLPALRMLRVLRHESGPLQLLATDLDAFVGCSFENSLGEPIDFLVAFDPLSRTVKGCCPTDRLTLIRSDTNVSLRHLLAGRPVERVLESLGVEEWPQVPEVEAPEIPLDEAVKESLLRALACCSTEPTRASIMGAWLDASDPTAHYVMGTDGRQLFSANSFRLPLKEPVFLPHHAFLERPDIRNDGPWSLAVKGSEEDGGWLQLRTRRWSFTTRRREHSMPNWRQVIPKDGTATVVFSEKAAAFLLDVLPKLPGAHEPHQPIRFDIVDQRLLVTAGDKSTPQGTTLLVEDANVTGKDLAITVDRNFALKALKWGLHQMALVDALSPIVFSASGRRLVVMPMRTEGLSPVRIPEPTTETPMPTNTEPSPEPQPVNRLDPEPSPEPQKPTIRSVLEQIDTLRDALRSTLRQFGDVMDALRAVEKDRKATDKEVELVREKLRALQGVSF